MLLDRLLAKLLPEDVLIALVSAWQRAKDPS